MDYKNEFQKFLIRYYENNYWFTYLVFEMNWWNEKFLDSYKWKNRNLLYKKCYNVIDKVARQNVDYHWYEYSSRVIEQEKCN